MGWRIKSYGTGAVEIVPVDTASDVVVSMPAANGKLTYSDSSTGGMFLPTGTTAQRPTGGAGMIRFNTTTGSVEIFNGSSWS
jgi:hypothetical protein